MLVILLSYFYLRQKKIRCIDYILWIIILVWFFDRTNCKTTIIVAVMFLISFFMTNFFKSKKLHQGIYWFSNIILITVVASSLYLTFFFDEENIFMKKIDIVLSFRPTIMFQAYQNFGISLFGQHVNLNMVDNSFIRLLLLNGLFFFWFSPADRLLGAVLVRNEDHEWRVTKICGWQFTANTNRDDHEQSNRYAHRGVNNGSYPIIIGYDGYGREFRECRTLDIDPIHRSHYGCQHRNHGNGMAYLPYGNRGR